MSLTNKLLKKKAKSKLEVIEVRKRNENPVIVLEDRLIPAQLKFIKSKSRFKVARCSRRAGKSTGLAFYMRDTALKGNHFNCAYVGKTIAVAVRTIWDALKELIAESKDNVKINESEHWVYFYDTKSYIWLFGANDSKQIEKMRGLYFKLAVIDEAQMFPAYLKKLIDEVIDPALGDLQGTLCLTGTPNASCSGVFYDFDHSDGWESHFWTWQDNHYFVNKAMSQNPELKEPMDIMRESLKRRGVSERDPAALREWGGQWAKSEDLQVYKYTDSMNHYDSLPNVAFKCVLGVDLGFNDSDAIIVLGFNELYRETYVLEEFKCSKLDITELAHEIQRLKDKWKPYYMVIDGGALGKKINEELNNRHNLFLDSADKTNKAAYIELLNSDLRLGYAKIKKTSDLAKEMSKLCWDEEDFEEGKYTEDAYEDNHLCDAYLYAWRYVYTYAWKEKPPELRPTDPTYNEVMAQKQLEDFVAKRQLDKERRENDRNWTDNSWGLDSWN